MKSDSYEWCIDSNFHKEKPGKESSLYEQCEPWKQHSCCTKNTTIRAHDKTNHYKFNFDLCGPMSEDCKRHFIQDLCFYECEPNLKPWVVKVRRSFARERIFNVPICSSDCDIWWEKCKYESTCAYNWARDFKWINGTNTCHPNSKCRKLNDTYLGGAKEFCEKVWDHSWKYTPQDKPCMRIWFNGSLGNPNEATAKYYATALNHCDSKHQNWFCLLVALILILSKFKSFSEY